MKHRETILVAEDEVPIQRIICRLLKRCGLDVLLAKDGSEAWDLLEANFDRIRVIISDWMMAPVSGMAFLKQVNESKRYQHIPFLMLTAKNQPADQVFGTLSGASQYIVKPFDNEVLIAKVLAAIKVYYRQIKIEKRADDQIQKIASQSKIDLQRRDEIIEKMTTLADTGESAAIVVHDAKNVTSAMTMDLEMCILPTLKSLLPDGEEAKEVMESLLEHQGNLKFCTESLNSLLAISREDDEIIHINMYDVVTKSISLLRSKLQSTKVDIKMDPTLLVLGTSSLIRVMTNLLGNAADELVEAGRADPTILIYVEKEDDKSVQIIVKDNGRGIPPEVLETINQGLRVSTKGSQGNGFGLLGAKGIVERCEGQLLVDSQPGRGTSFIIKLKK